MQIEGGQNLIFIESKDLWWAIIAFDVYASCIKAQAESIM